MHSGLQRCRCLPSLQARYECCTQNTLALTWSVLCLMPCAEELQCQDICKHFSDTNQAVMQSHERWHINNILPGVLCSMQSATDAVMSVAVAGGQGRRLRRESAWRSSSDWTRHARSASSRRMNRLPRLSNQSPPLNAVIIWSSMSDCGGFHACCRLALRPGMLADTIGCSLSHGCRTAM